MFLNDAEALRKTLTKIINFKYEIIEDGSDFSPNSDDARWYLLVNEEIPKIYHARIIWLDKDDSIRIESMYLGNTTEWIGQDYGEDGVIAATRLDYPDLQSTRKVFAENFPREARRIDAYQEILDDISSKYGIHLELICKGGKMGATFFMGAIVKTKDTDDEEKAERIKRNLKGLKEALKRMEGYEAKQRKRTT